MRFFTTALALGVLLCASRAPAYTISAQSLGAGGFRDSHTLDQVEAGNVLDDGSGNEVDGHALTSGASGSLGGHMKVRIDDYSAAQSPPLGFTSFLLEKQWKSSIAEYIEDLQLDPGATELVVRLNVSGEDMSDLVPAPTDFNYDNGYARAHVWARLIYSNAHAHVAGLSQIQVDGRTDRDVPGDWMEVFGGDSSPAGYGTGTTGSTSAAVELHIPASEVDGDDSLFVSAQLYGEVRGGHWSGAFTASELHGGMSLEIVGGDGAPQNPIFLSAPEPEGVLLGGCALAALVAIRRRADPVVVTHGDVQESGGREILREG